MPKYLRELTTVPSYQDMVCIKTGKAQDGRDFPGKFHSGLIYIV